MTVRPVRQVRSTGSLSRRLRPTFDFLEGRVVLSVALSPLFEFSGATANAVAVDQSGDTYVAGTLNGSVNLNPLGSNIVTAPSAAGAGYVVKYSPSGAFLWDWEFYDPTSLQGAAYGLTLDSQGVCVVGQYGYSAFVENLDSQTGQETDYDYFQGGTSQANAVAVNSFGEILVTGSFSGTIETGAFDGPSSITAVGNQDYFVAEFASLLATITVTSSGTVGQTESGTGIAIDPAGNIDLTGTEEGYEGDTDVFEESGFVTQLDSAFTPIWTQSLDSNTGGTAYGSVTVSGIVVDGLGNVDVVGSLDGSAYFYGNVGTVTGPDSLDELFVASFNDSSGSSNWFYGEGDGVTTSYGTGIGVDASNNVYVTGSSYYYDSFDGDGTTFYDALETELNDQGEFVGSSPLSTTNGSAQGIAIGVNTAGTVAVVGSYSGTLQAADGSFPAPTNGTSATFIANSGLMGLTSQLATAYQAGSSNETGSASPSFTGTASPGDGVQVYDGQTLVAVGIAGTDGTYTATSIVTLVAGTYSISAISYGSDGYGPATAPFFLTVLPRTSAPSDLELSAAYQAGSSTETGSTTPSFTGTAMPGAGIQIFDGQTLVAVGTAGSDGSFTAKAIASLPAGMDYLTAAAFDSRGYGTSVTPIVTTVLSYTSAPSGLALSTAYQAGSSNVTGSTTPSFTGMAMPGAGIQIYDGQKLVAVGTAGPSGTFTATAIAAIPAGMDNLYAGAFDARGYGFRGPSFAVTVLSYTSAPSGLSVATAYQADSSTETGSTTPSFTGTAMPGAGIQIYDGQTLVAVGTAGPNGSFTATAIAALPAGDDTLYAGAFDARGYGFRGQSFVVTVLAYTSAPTGPGLSAAYQAGSSTVTGSTTPAFVGTATPGAGIQIYDGQTLVAVGNAGPTGSYTATTIAPLPAGVDTLYAVAFDARGYGLGGPSFEVTVLPNTSAPAGVGLAASSQAGSMTQTDSTTPVFIGTATPGSGIQIYDGQTLVAVGNTSPNGTFTAYTIHPLSEGAYTLFAVAYDARGYGFSGEAFTITVLA